MEGEGEGDRGNGVTSPPLVNLVVQGKKGRRSKKGRLADRHCLCCRMRRLKTKWKEVRRASPLYLTQHSWPRSIKEEGRLQGKRGITIRRCWSGKRKREKRGRDTGGPSTHCFTCPQSCLRGREERKKKRRREEKEILFSYLVGADVRKGGNEKGRGGKEKGRRTRGICPRTNIWPIDVKENQEGEGKLGEFRQRRLAAKKGRVRRERVSPYLSPPRRKKK